MRADFYIIDTRSNTIVNCVNSESRAGAEKVVALMRDPEHMRIDANPPMSLLRNYRYWNERP